MSSATTRRPARFVLLRCRSALATLVLCMATLATACGTPEEERPEATSSTSTPSAATRSPSESGSTPSPGSATSTPERHVASPSRPDDGAATESPEAACRSGKPLIVDAEWIEVESQPSLEVTPSDLLRSCLLAAVDEEAWAEVLALAPEAESPGMREQFTCHKVFASTKSVWHLEPWRPVVDGPDMLAARCNPGGADPDLP